MQPTKEFAVARDGARLAYRRRGNAEGPHIVMIHSLALDDSVWNGVASELERTADVLTYDCRGHGASERQAGGYTVDLFADDLADLCDHVGWPDAVVVGCSMGGCVAQAFAAAYPQRTAGLGLIDTTAWYGPNAPDEWRQRADKALSEGLSGLAGFQTTRWFSDGFREANPDVVRETLRVFLDNDLRCYAATCAMLGKADLRPYLPDLGMPVAVVVGEEDYATPVSAAEAIHAAVPGSTLTVIERGRHLTPIEHPDRIVGELQALIGRVRREATQPA
jgi:3-oxoadipate enol-lactonase